ncbi:hypothetical protein GJAV_G00123220 [Gymnothorax javanicus]|nr:hypothetical protein GJAV_G00123220 [Gymnothorax javanicus]
MASGAFHLRCMWISNLPDNSEHPNGDVRWTNCLPLLCPSPPEPAVSQHSSLYLPDGYTRPGEAPPLIFPVLSPPPRLFCFLNLGIARPPYPPSQLLLVP